MNNEKLYLASNIKYLRTINNNTQQEVARYCNKTNTAISNWEKGIREPDAVDLAKLSNFFNISMDDMLLKDLRFENIELPLRNSDIEKLSLKRETFSLRLKKIMNERNLKQVDILKLCEPYFDKYNIKLNINDLNQYISDNIQPNYKIIDLLSEALDVEYTWLMGIDPKNDLNDYLRKIDINDIEKIVKEDKEHKLISYIDFFDLITYLYSDLGDKLHFIITDEMINIISAIQQTVMNSDIKQNIIQEPEKLLLNLKKDKLLTFLKKYYTKKDIINEIYERDIFPIIIKDDIKKLNISEKELKCHIIKQKIDKIINEVKEKNNSDKKIRKNYDDINKQHYIVENQEKVLIELLNQEHKNNTDK